MYLTRAESRKFDEQAIIDFGMPGLLLMEPTIIAEHTCTFVAEKVGFTNPLAHDFLGTVHVVDIGAPRKLYETLAPRSCNK